MAASKRRSSGGSGGSKAKPAPPAPAAPSTGASAASDSENARARSRAVALLGIVLALVALSPIVRVRDRGIERAVAVSALVSLAGFFATRALIPLVAARTLRAGLFGMDINKKGKKRGGEMGGNKKEEEEEKNIRSTPSIG